ncbi:MAG: N-acetylmuramic acid phosphotransfer permease, partial [Mycoplasmataceae bacterium]|nr:N-acetylmuramic acid phosphotransfer permease [Mycoplasmataceae bacterium]
MKKNTEEIAKNIIKFLGGIDNIESYTNCMTRFRVKIINPSLVDLKNLKTSEKVLGVNIAGDEFQVILGPGLVDRVTQTVRKLFPEGTNTSKIDESVPEKELTLQELSDKNKIIQKEKTQSPITRFLSKFSKIFTPLIFAFIGAGILSGVAGMLQSFGTTTGIGADGNPTLIFNNDAIESWFNFLNASLQVWLGAFIIIVGWRTAEVFGGRGVTGALLAAFFVPQFSAIYTAPFIASGDGFNFLGMHIEGESWLTRGFRPEYNPDSGLWVLSYASGGIFGAMILVGISIPIEKQISKFVPDSIDLVLTSTLTFLFLIFIAYFLVIPISGMLFTGVNWLFQTLYQNAFGAAILAGIFLLAVVFGVHQGFVPIYIALLDDVGINALFPILAMAGAGQVGVAIALYNKSEKDSVLRKQIKGAIIPGFLGIGEPLIYGVTLPR